MARPRPARAPFPCALFASLLGSFKYVRSHPESLVPASRFAADAAAGTLPSVAFVDPLFFAAP